MTVVEYDSAKRRGRWLEELLDLLHSRVLVRALVERDMKVRYKRSTLGILWTMGNPMAMLLALSVVFAGILGSHTPAYPAFAAPGVLLWTFFAQTTASVAHDVSLGVDLWRRIRLPKTALISAAVAGGALNLCLATLLLIVVLVAAGRAVGAALLTLPVTIALLLLFVLGVSLILATVAAYFSDIAHVYGVLLPSLMFTATVAYPATIVVRELRPFITWNPISLYVEAFRAPLYANAFPAASSFGAMAAVAAVTLTAGWLLFTHFADDIAYRI